jgi:hypothetical protein
MDNPENAFFGSPNCSPNTTRGRPNSTITQGDWAAYGAASLWEATDDATSDEDATYASIDGSAASRMFEIKFSGQSPLIWHVLVRTKIWARTQGGSGDETMDVAMYKGTALIKTLASGQALTDSYVLYSYDLANEDTEQFLSEDEWRDIRVRISANSLASGENIYITMIELQMDCGPYPWQDQGLWYIWDNIINGNPSPPNYSVRDALSAEDDSGYPYYVTDRNVFYSPMPGYSPYAYPFPGGIDHDDTTADDIDIADADLADGSDTTTDGNVPDDGNFVDGVEAQQPAGGGCSCTQSL